MAPGSPTVVRRPFHWGVVFLTAEEAKADVPIPERDRMVSANETGISVGVRHAQDTDALDGEYLKYAETEIRLSALDAPLPSSLDRREVYRGSINLPSGRLNVGDADDEVVVRAHSGRNIVSVFVSSDAPPDEMSPDLVWVDLTPA